MDNLGGHNNGFIKKVLMYFVILVLTIFIAIKFFQFFFNININAYFSDLFTNKPKMNVVVDQSSNSNTTNNSDSNPQSVPEIKLYKQVFNIPGNHYNYENAKAICSAYGSSLATYKQVEKSYKKGGEWCNYGWSDGQMALYPTQQKTYDKLQTIEGHQHDCGRPGINGGYIANPHVRFGVNCYGYKPKMTKHESELMDEATPYPETAKDVMFKKRVDHWKTKLDEILVSPFNHDSWGAGLI